MKRLILIDGHAILHRAYHALPPLTTSKGELVNAVFGFSSMLLKLRDELSPSYLAVSFDLPKPTFRQKIFKDYQIQRPKMADELAGQVEKIKKVVRALGIPIYEKEGFEADDVIGTLARQANQLSVISFQLSEKSQSVSRSIGQQKRETEKPKNQKLKTENREPITEIIIVTGDRDLLQLVDEQTKVYMLIRGLTEATLFDQAKVEEKLGLKPGQIPDYKALIGDQSDNYPGVNGIGPKTAVDLVSKYGTIDKLYKTIGQLSNKAIREKLIKNKQNAEMSLRLATIVTNVPVRLDLEKSKVETFNTPKVRKLFAELEFKSLIPRLSGGQNKKPAIMEVRKPKNENTETNEQLSLV